MVPSISRSHLSLRNFNPRDPLFLPPHYPKRDYEILLCAQKSTRHCLLPSFFPVPNCKITPFYKNTLEGWLYSIDYSANILPHTKRGAPVLHTSYSLTTHRSSLSDKPEKLISWSIGMGSPSLLSVICDENILHFLIAITFHWTIRCIDCMKMLKPEHFLRYSESKMFYLLSDVLEESLAAPSIGQLA